MEKLCEKLREDITFGKYKPGEHLSEKQLTETYGVSRVTIRKAIEQIATQGYLTVEKNRGATVTKLSLKDVEVIYNILMRCESYAAKLFAARKLTNVNQKLKLLHEKMHTKENNFSSHDWLKLNDEFHMLIFSNCGSNILSELVYHTRQRIYRYRMFQTEAYARNHYSKDHKKILAAIFKGDEKLTEKLMVAHLDVARKHRLQLLKGFENLL
ncbi:transcriptional regulator [Desulfosarcina widdelii]|uniref:Transcriptional regulator n=1 Tax=Desulfosarcina widdelii TaxID=947919 RepID=A0A5K7YZM2_9BACT|nr:GntR family transcriptional regulator [Desulfosarcina widdelii]BBO72631.1 transcriptional regulator [Desulfosarcina widdelii]